MGRLSAATGAAAGGAARADDPAGLPVDAVTGLPDAGLLDRRAREAIDESRRDRTRVALLCLGVDGFSTVNAAHGREGGDALLAQIGARLSACVRQYQREGLLDALGGRRPGDCVVRLRADEFAVLSPGLARMADAQRVAERLLEAMRVPFALGGARILLTASVGGAIAGWHASEVRGLIAHAQAAMHEAKARGGDRCVLPDLPSQVAAQADPQAALGREPARLNTQEELFDAVRAGSFELLYQPRLPLGGGTPTGFEALLRWRRGHALVAPESFLPLARESRLMRAMTGWVLERACAELRGWRTGSGLEATLALNVDAADVAQRDFVDALLGTLLRYDLAPAALWLETPAGQLAEPSTELRAGLGRLRARGVRFGIDGLGGQALADSGAGTVAWMRQIEGLEVTGLSLDRTLVARVDTDRRAADAVARICAHARVRGLRTLAVGVERAAQLQALQELGCDEAQGLLLAMPMHSEQAGHWLLRRMGTVPGLTMPVGHGEG